MSSSKPRLAIVSSHNICCPLAYYADALKEFLSPAFDVEIIDLKTSLLRMEGKNYEALSAAYIDEISHKLREFDLVNVHLELGIFGTVPELIAERVIQLCQAAGRLLLTVHTIDYNEKGGHAHLYQKIMQSLKERPVSNPFHLIAHLPQENLLLRKHFALENVSDFPLIYLSNERRAFFQQSRNQTVWKKQFGFKEEDLVIGVFGLLSPHKYYLHALKTLKLLPDHYKLLIIGEAHHMNIKCWKVDPVIEEMTSFLDQNPSLANRLFFAGRRPDANYYEDVANCDYVLLSSFEVNQSGSATFSNALELSCATLKSNTANAREYNIYFPDCFEVFDVGNHYETKDKILHFNKAKVENLRKRIDLFSEVQLRELYLKIYEPMKTSSPVPLKKSPLIFSFSEQPSSPNLSRKASGGAWPVRTLFNLLPPPCRALVRKAKQAALK